MDDSHLDGWLKSAGHVLLGKVVEDGAEIVGTEDSGTQYRFFVIEIVQCLLGNIQDVPPANAVRFPIYYPGMTWDGSMHAHHALHPDAFRGEKGETYYFFLQFGDSRSRLPRVVKEFEGHAPTVVGYLPSSRREEVALAIKRHQQW